MSFGAIQHMVITTKNNANLLNKRERFKKGFGLSTGKKSARTEFPQISAIEIKTLRAQLQAENKRKQLQTNIATVVFGLVLVMFVYLLLN